MIMCKHNIIHIFLVYVMEKLGPTSIVVTILQILIQKSIT